MATTDKEAWHAGEPHIELSTDVGYFRKIMEALDSVRDEGKIVVTPENIYSKVVDPANAMMCLCRIQGRALNGITVEGVEEMVIGSKFADMEDLLSGTSKNSELEVRFPFSYNGSNNIQLRVIDEDLVFNKPALNPDTVPSIPQNDPITHPTRVVVSGTDLKKSINHAEKTLDPDAGSVVFGTEEDLFYVESSDQVSGSFRKEFHQSGPSEGEGLGEHRTEIGYGFLEDIKNVLGASSEITIHIKDKNPVRFDVDLDDEGAAQIVYLIAPRLDDQ